MFVELFITLSHLGFKDSESFQAKHHILLHLYMRALSDCSHVACAHSQSEEQAPRSMVATHFLDCLQKDAAMPGSIMWEVLRCDSI